MNELEALHVAAVNALDFYNQSAAEEHLLEAIAHIEKAMIAEDIKIGEAFSCTCPRDSDGERTAVDAGCPLYQTRGSCDGGIRLRSGMS